jgi:N-formylglutamate deformylase
MTPVTIVQGQGPVILGQPHSGTYLPEPIFEALNETGRQLLDTDWHIPLLYDGLLADATIVRANFSRYVIDANRPPDGASLYPGQNGTSLVPTYTFDGQPIWRTSPPDHEIADRINDFHRPYHAALSTQIDRIKALHGFAVLYDCHSIRSEIPFLFDHRLPDLNIGDNNGTTCAPALTRAVSDICASTSHYTHVVNGRFKGGWTTRHYGRPSEGVHALQMELAQRCYLASETHPFDYSIPRADKFRSLLQTILNAVSSTAQSSL